MKAMILAAGLGTRLRPLTDNTPKALVALKGKPFLQRTIEYLKSYGFDEIIVNIHHFGEQIIEFLEAHKNFGIRIEVSDERGELLDTGGGLKKTAWFFDHNQPFLLINADVFTDLNLEEFYQSHLEQEALVSLAIRERKTSRYLVFDENNLRLHGRVNEKKRILEMPFSNPNINSYQLLAFSGIHVIHPKLFSLMIGEGKFSIIETYLRLAPTQKIVGYRHDHSKWIDLGTPERLKEAEKHVILE